MSQQTDCVIAEMMQYLRGFVEIPHQVFNNLLVCPFARKARLDNTIMFQVYPFAQDELVPNSEFMEIVTTFTQDNTSEILIVIHPDKTKLSVTDMAGFVNALNEQLAPLELVGFGGHPHDPFHIQGLHTRRSPYPHLSIQSTPYLQQVTQALHGTGHYHNWSHADLEAIGFHQR